MSDTDGKKPPRSRPKKAAREQPVKRGRKRKASRPPTIDVEAVRVDENLEAAAKDVEAEAAKPADEKPTEAAEEASKETPVEETTAPEVEAAAQETSNNVENSDTAQKFGYGALATSAGVGALTSAVLIAGVFGFNAFSSDQNALESQIAGLSAKLEKVSTTVANSATDTIDADIKAVGDRISNLEAGVKAAQNAPVVPDAHIEAFGDRIANLEAGLKEAQNSADTSDAVKQVDERLSALNGKILEARTVADKSLQQVGLLEQALKSAGDDIKGATVGSVSEITAQGLKLAGFEANIKRLEVELVELQTSAGKSEQLDGMAKTIVAMQETASALTTKISALAEQQATVNAAQNKSEAFTTDMTQRLSALEQVDHSNIIGRRAAFTFALEGLVRAVETGAPFERDLDIVTSALPKNDQLVGLQDVAKTGVKSVAYFQQQFPAVLRAILDARPAASEPGVVDRFVGKAKSLIRVRRVGEVTGSDLEAVVARMEARVKAGDLASAFTEAQSLEGPPALAAKIWVEGVDLRLGTLKLVGQIRKNVIAGLDNENTKPTIKE